MSLYILYELSQRKMYPVVKISESKNFVFPANFNLLLSLKSYLKGQADEMNMEERKKNV